MTTTKLLLSIPEACEVLGLGRSTVCELIRSGELRSVKVGRRRLVPMAGADEYVAGLGHAELV